LLSDVGIIGFGRFNKESSVLVFVNHNYYDRPVTLDVSLINMPLNGTVCRVFQSGERSYNIGVKKTEVADGILSVTLPAFSSTVYAVSHVRDEEF
jgi:hypothetical protein